ncbi:unnamed protein product, partial [Cyprideis torosa]
SDMIRSRWFFCGVVGNAGGTPGFRLLLANVKCGGNVSWFCSGNSSSSGSSSDEENEKKPKRISRKISSPVANLSPEEEESRREAASKKLEQLLSSMKTGKYVPPVPSQPLDLTKPLSNEERVKIREQHATEEELEQRKASRGSRLQAGDLEKAAEDVAHMVGGDISETKSELLKRLATPQEKSAGGLGSLLVGMKVVTKEDATQKAAAARSRPQPPAPLSFGSKADNLGTLSTSKGLFSGKPLKIFGPADRAISKDEPERKNFFDQCVERLDESGYISGLLGCLVHLLTKAPRFSLFREVRLSVIQSPRNGFEEMIVWTEQGKLWHFPIDNEQGLEDEKAVSWHEHVFLDEHLEGWCPESGPIRHFMELVCIGLSKNPYITAAYKRETIEWYKNYFDEKKDFLQRIGATE